MPLDQRAVMALASAPGPQEQWYRIGEVRSEVVGDQPADAGEGQDATATSADVYVFGSIGGWSGVTAKDFVRDVAGLAVDKINLHLNSPGGLSSEGVAIANVLRQHKASITVWIDGMAASAASCIAMAGDEVVMGIGSQMMIHDAWGLCQGNEAEMLKAAEMLASTSNAYAEAYANKAGGTAEQWRAVMEAEAWYTPTEAVAAGLADRVATSEDNGRASGQQVIPGNNDPWLFDMWDSLSSADRHADVMRALYGKASRAEAGPPPALSSAVKSPAATARGPKERSGSVAFTDEHLATLRTQLDLAADAGEDEIVAKVTEVSSKKEPAKPEAQELPPGTALVSSAVLDELRAQAAQGVAARAEQERQRREGLVLAAVTDGRIRPADRESWLSDLAADPERKEATLASLTPGLVPLAEIGTSVASGDPEADALYAQVFGKEG